MRTVHRFSRFLNPIFLRFRFLSLFSPKRIWETNLQSATRLGLVKPVFILSFDCDTDLDISVVEGVHSKLLSVGIRPIYAVPGELLILGSEVYKRIRESGAEFINHGYKSHSEVSLPDRKYHGTFFYEKSEESEILEDIVLGHQTIRRVLGLEAKVFRTPHFGGFSKTSHLRLLWEALANLNYQVSSSTTPFFGYVNGPLSIHSGISELPVSGDPRKPHQILDSWSYTFSGNSSLTRVDFINALEEFADAMRLGKKVFLNIYADPSQVYDWPEFFEAVAKMSTHNVGSFLTARSTFSG